MRFSAIQQQLTTGGGTYETILLLKLKTRIIHSTIAKTVIISSFGHSTLKHNFSYYSIKLLDRLIKVGKAQNLQDFQGVVFFMS